MNDEQPITAPQNGKGILYFHRHSSYFEQWTFANGARVDLPDLVNPKSSAPGLCMTHWPTRRYVKFDEVIERTNDV